MVWAPPTKNPGYAYDIIAGISIGGGPGPLGPPWLRLWGEPKVGGRHME